MVRRSSPRRREGVVRTRGRLWLAGRSDQAMWLESAGDGLRVSVAGKWLAAMTTQEIEWESTSGARHYPLVIVEISADSHAFWTGRQRLIDAAGQVEKFHRRYGRRT